MADILDLLTLDEALTAVNLTSVAHTDQLEQFVTAISRRIDEMCGPVVIRTVTDEVYDGGTGVVFLKSWPVDSVTSVTEYTSGTPTVLTAETVSTSGDYTVRNGILARRSGWMTSTWGPQLTVTYEAGRYADTESVDAKFKMAASAVLAGAWAKYAGAWARGGDPFEDPNAGGPGFFDELGAAVKRWLSDEMRPPVVA